MLKQLGYCGVFATLLAGCTTTDEFSNYVQRKDTITLAAGNAKEANATTHTISPWPPYVMDTRIIGNGYKGAHAVECYENRTAPAQPGAQNNSGGTQIIIGGAGAGAGTGPTPQQGGCNRLPIVPIYNTSRSN